MGNIKLNTSDIKLCLGAAEISAAYLGDEKVYPVETSIPNYLSFTNKGTQDISLLFDSPNQASMPLRNFEYSYDGINFTTWNDYYTNSGNGIVIEPNKTIYMRGDNTTIAYSNSIYLRFWYQSPPDSNTSLEAHGNIMSLLSKTGFEELTTVPAYCFCNLFESCVDLTTAPELPATTVGQYAYSYMFSGCTSLTTAPSLPATTLTDNCYQYMFNGCTSLTTAGTISATTLATKCCYNMFNGCTSLTTAPSILPATTLANGCYWSMFFGCTSLTTAPELPATTLANDCYFYMFYKCTSLTTVPSILPATTLASECYGYMFMNCTSLTTAPALPATTLVTSCYNYMFYGCNKLNYIKAMFTTSPGYKYTNYWASSVASTGTFVKNAEATWNVSGNNGIPYGWTVETASP